MTRRANMTHSERNLLRSYITSHANWPEYRAEFGINSAALTAPACLAYCARYNIVPADAIREQRDRAPVAPDNVFSRANTTSPVTATTSPVTASPASATSPDTSDAAKALAHALSLMQTSVDPAQVRALIDDAIKPLRQQIAEIETPLPVIEYVDSDEKTIGTLPPVRHPQAETICKLAILRDASGNRPNIWIAGPMGSGKTTIARQCADALGLAFGFHGSAMLPHEFLGFVDAHGQYRETQFVKLYRDGGLCLIDEIDGSSAQATLVLNAALANGVLSCPNGEIVKRHPDFVCIGAANTWGFGATHEYVGRNRLDAAFLDRFAYKIALNYDPKLERHLARENDDVLSVVASAREYIGAQGLKIAVTPRTGAALASLIDAGFTMSQACDMTFCSGLSADQVKDIKSACGVKG